MKFKIVLVMVLMGLLMLAGCGGGGGSKTKDPVTSDPSLQGGWTFSNDTSKNLLLGDGLDFWLLQMDAQYNPQGLVVFNSSGLRLPWQVQGGQFDLLSEDPSAMIVNVGLEKNQNDSVNLTMGQETYPMTPFVLSSDLSKAVGTWTANYSGLSEISIVIDDRGEVTGQWQISADTCRVTGALSPKNGVAFFALSYTEGNGCVRGEQSLSGIGLVAEFSSSQRLYLLLTDDNNSVGAVFMGIKSTEPQITMLPYTQ